jgi:hypothetical protein
VKVGDRNSTAGWTLSNFGIWNVENVSEPPSILLVLIALFVWVPFRRSVMGRAVYAVGSAEGRPSSIPAMTAAPQFLRDLAVSRNHRTRGAGIRAYGHSSAPVGPT